MRARAYKKYNSFFFQILKLKEVAAAANEDINRVWRGGDNSILYIHKRVKVYNYIITLFVIIMKRKKNRGKKREKASGSRLIQHVRLFHRKERTAGWPIKYQSKKKKKKNKLL